MRKASQPVRPKLHLTFQKPRGTLAHQVKKEEMNTTEKPRRTSFEETLHSARRTMLMSEILKLAMDSFRAAKTRFVLTALGMVIGTASVILVVTIGMTGRQYVLQLIQKFGTNSVEVEYAGGGAMGSGPTWASCTTTPWAWDGCRNASAHAGSSKLSPSGA